MARVALVAACVARAAARGALRSRPLAWAAVAQALALYTVNAAFAGGQCGWRDVVGLGLPAATAGGGAGAGAAALT